MNGFRHLTSAIALLLLVQGLAAGQSLEDHSLLLTWDGSDLVGPTTEPSFARECDNEKSAAACQAPAQPGPAPGLFSVLGLLGTNADSQGIRLSGWEEMGYTTASSGAGRLAVQPAMNHYGQEFLLDQFALVLEKPVDKDHFSLGFRAELFSGADASFLQGPGDIQNTDPRFGFVIRQLYASAHAPLLSEGGLDFELGRRGTPMGYESYMAPSRPFYSLSYQWDYAEDGADTGFWTTWHASDRLDLVYAVTMGANTFFTFRTSSPSHLAEVAYWLQDAKRTRLVVTFLMGDQAVGNTLPVQLGTLDTVLELRLEQTWSKEFTQILQANYGCTQSVPVLGLGQWCGLLSIGLLHITPQVDAQARLEWFDDIDGTRTGFPSNYWALTTGIDWHPQSWLSFRPEIRGDFAGERAFGPAGTLDRTDHQLSVGLECLIRF